VRAEPILKRRLKAASLAFGLRTGSRRLFQTDRPAMADPGGEFTGYKQTQSQGKVELFGHF